MHHTHHLIFPLPWSIHIGFVVISSLLLIFCYIKTKRRYDLYMLIGVLSTLLIDIMIDPPYFYLFAAEEIGLLILTSIDMHKVSKQLEAQRQAEEEKKAAEKSEDADKSADTENNDENSTP